MCRPTAGSALGRLDFTAVLRPMPFLAGTLDDENSDASVWMRGARDAGLVR